jgi:hypothetical protein
MAMLFGGGSNNPTEINQVRVTQSALGNPIPVVMGRQSIQSSLIWMDGFTGKQEPQGGKGGGKGGQFFIYAANVAAALVNGPINGINDVWTGQSWLSNNTTLETYIIAGSGIYTPLNASTLATDHGVGIGRTYSATYNDPGAPSPTVLAGTDYVPMVNVVYGTSLTTGHYSIDPATGNYHFNTSTDAGNTVQISYSYRLQFITQQDIALIPSGKTVSVGGTITYRLDLGVKYYGGVNDGVALSYVTGTPTVTGTYTHSSYGGSGGVYTFATGDIAAEVLISYRVEDDSVVGQDQPTTLNFQLFGGTQSQTPWSFLTASYPGAALGYTNLAYVAYDPMNLGTSAQIQDNRFEVTSPDVYGAGYVDCNPVTCLTQVLTNTVWGLGSGQTPFPTSVIDNGTNGTWGGAPGTAGARTVGSTAWEWFAAQSFLISPIIDQSDTAASVMAKWIEAGCCAAFYSEGLLKLRPYGDTSAAANGCTWVACGGNLSSPGDFIVALDDTCFTAKEGEDPVKIDRSAWQDGYNETQVRWNNRTAQYSPEITQESDQAAINRYGLRREDPLSWDFITELPAATYAANMRVKRMVNIRNKFVFTVPFTYSYLEPLDCIYITTSSIWAAGLNNENLSVTNLPVRITKVVDDPKTGLEITCEDFPWGVHQPVLFNKGISAGEVPSNAFANPGETEIVMFEASNRLTGYSGNEIWIGATGTGTDWGSSNVWVSQDATNYMMVGNISKQARMGVLNNTLYTSGNWVINSQGAFALSPYASHSLTITDNIITDPLSGTTASKLVGTSSDSYLNQLIIPMPNIGGAPVVLSFYAKVPSGTHTINAYILNQATTQRGTAALALTTTWQRFSITCTMNSLDTAAYLQIGGASTLGTSLEVHAWGAQFEFGSTASAYIATKTIVPLGGDPCTNLTMVADLVADSPALDAGTTTDADLGNTMCFVDGEVVSYSTLTLTGNDQYSMGTYLRRGQMGTGISNHIAGTSLFLRLDSSVFKYTYDPTWAGKTLYFKFQSLNVFGNNPIPLADLTAVVFTVPGLNPGTIDASSGLVLSAPSNVVGAGPLPWSPVTTTVDTTIGYSSGTTLGWTYPAGTLAPAVVNANYWYVRWTGYLVPSTTGNYTVGVNVDDQANLYLGGYGLVEALAGGSVGGVGSPLVMTTTIAAYTAHNTSACAAYNQTTHSANFGTTTWVDTSGTTLTVNPAVEDLSLVPITPGHVSPVSVKTLIPSFTGKWYAHLNPWFGTGTSTAASNHADVGIDCDTNTWVEAMMQDMQARGFDGLIIDWYGSTSYEDKVTQRIKAQAALMTNFTYVIMIDSVFSTLSDLEGHLTYMQAQYFGTPGYQSIGADAVVYFWGPGGVLSSADYTTAKGSTTTTMKWLFQGTGTLSYSDGNYDWVHPYDTGVPGGDPYNATDANSFLTSTHSSSKSIVPCISPGFNGYNTVVHESGYKKGWYMPRDYGKCWLTQASVVNANVPTNCFGIQVSTWCDYEEGSPIEPGIDNSITVSSSLTGSVLTWSVSGGTGDETTISSYDVTATSDGVHAAQIYTEGTGGGKRFDLSTITTFGAGTTYTIQVMAIGVACIRSQFSATHTFTATGTAVTGAGESTTAYKYSTPMSLTAGVYYPLVLEWNNYTGPYVMQLLWTPPGSTTPVVIPSGNLSTANTVTTGNLSGSWWNGTPGLFFPGEGVIDFSNTQVEDIQVVDSTVTVTNTIFSPVSGDNSFPTTPCWITGQAWSAAGILDFFIPSTASSTSGYFFRLDYRGGFYPLIVKTSNIAVGSTWVVISTLYVPANPLPVTGWVEFAFYVGLNGYMSIWINGVIAADTTDTTYIPNGTVQYGYEVVSGAKIGPGLLSTTGSTFLNNQSSIASVSDYTFTYSYPTSTRDSITWSWTSFLVYYPDGSTIVLAGGSLPAFTGLTTGVNYIFSMYVVNNFDGTGTAAILYTGTSQPTLQQQVQILNGDGNIPIAIGVVASIPASGGGGTGGGGTGGGYTCFSPNTKVLTERGNVCIGDIIPFKDRVLTARGTWKMVTGVTSKDYTGPMLNMGNEELSTLTHWVLEENWKPMEQLNRFPSVEYSGTIHNLHVYSDPKDDGMGLDTEHSYTLANGLIVHNFFTLPN